MDTHKIDFANIPWQQPVRGVRYKAFVHGNQRMRLVEFSEGFVEEDWCIAGHAGYVLEGSFAIDFKGSRENFNAGDSLFIPAGSQHGHKAIIGPGERVLLLLFEII